MSFSRHRKSAELDRAIEKGAGKDTSIGRLGGGAGNNAIATFHPLAGQRT